MPVFCDFGWSIQLGHGETRDTFCGTLEYIAPEIFKGEQYNKAADVWSLGVLLYEMLHGYSPFKGKNYKEVFEKVIRGEPEFEKSVPGRLRELIRDILSNRPQDRPPLECIIAETSEILSIENLLGSKEKPPYHMSLNLDGKEKVKFANPKAKQTTDPAKSNSPRFFKSTAGRIHFSKAETSRFPEESLVNSGGTQLVVVNPYLNAIKNSKRDEDIFLSSKQKQQKLISENNLKQKNKKKEMKFQHNSSSEKKLSVSLSLRRKKLKVYLCPGIGEEHSQPEADSFLQRTLKKRIKGIEYRKDSEGGTVKNKTEPNDTPEAFKDKSTPALLQPTNWGKPKVRKASSSKDNKNLIKSSKSGISNSKKLSNKTMSRNQSKPKMSGKLSESQKLLCRTPQERLDKDHFFKSMVNLQTKLESYDKDAGKSTLILNQINKKMASSKNGGEKRRVKVQSPLAIAQKTDGPASGKELFKQKAKSFRSAYSIFNLQTPTAHDKK